MTMVDIDGDGVKELAAIEEFHGCYYRIYKPTEYGGWVQVFEHPEVTEFYHVAWGGTLCGVPAFIGGCRRGKQQLFAITCKDGEFVIDLIDEGVGPSNACVYHGKDGDLVLAADREAAEAAVYKVLAD